MIKAFYVFIFIKMNKMTGLNTNMTKIKKKYKILMNKIFKMENGSLLNKMATKRKENITMNKK